MVKLCAFWIVWSAQKTPFLANVTIFRKNIFFWNLIIFDGLSPPLDELAISGKKILTVYIYFWIHHWASNNSYNSLNTEIKHIMNPHKTIQMCQVSNLKTRKNRIDLSIFLIAIKSVFLNHQKSSRVAPGAKPKLAKKETIPEKYNPLKIVLDIRWCRRSFFIFWKCGGFHSPEWRNELLDIISMQMKIAILRKSVLGH